jgi:hypothetical protein
MADEKPKEKPNVLYLYLRSPTSAWEILETVTEYAKKDGSFSLDELRFWESSELEKDVTKLFEEKNYDLVVVPTSKKEYLDIVRKCYSGKVIGYGRSEAKEGGYDGVIDVVEIFDKRFNAPVGEEIVKDIKKFL